MSESSVRKLILADGTEVLGKGFGSDKETIVEVVFNTSMVGYQEIVSDPSYTDQAVIMTYPLIGNYGMNDDDYETITPTISGLIVREYNDEPSNCRCTRTLSDVMKEYGIVGLSDIDTRKLARHIRNYGSCLAIITDETTSTSEALEKIKSYDVPKDAVERVSTKDAYELPAYNSENIGSEYKKSPVLKEEYIRITEDASAENKKFHVVAIDCGMKRNITREMQAKGLDVTVVPWNTSAEEILKLSPDGVFISNGPGDPTDVKATIETIKELKGKCPVFGICLGHQIISLAYGAKTYKLKFGHRGGNHPVKNLLTDKIEITSQNHSYAVDVDSVKNTDLEITHINLLDNTVEGVRCKKDKVMSVQYHPESAPGPQDSSYLFDEFIVNMQQWKEEKNA